MSQELVVLSITAVSIGFLHTLFGPDHYLPFIVIARAKQWSKFKTAWVSFICGLGHIGSSVILGLVGIALGIAVTKLTVIESFRGNIAAWALIAFGLVYFIWGLRKAWRNKPHQHLHFHLNEETHTHNHQHNQEHLHIHDSEKESTINLTPWILFTVFVFGPCEPLIPLLMYPAAKHSLFGMLLITAVFGTVTIATMMTIIFIGYLGISFIPLKKLERYTHALAGASILLCGIAIQFLGL
jgi:nickel/cobalt transporter (NicO) family protein